MFTSFDNAGWPNGGRDACQGDSGGPLVANLPGQFQMLRYSDIQRQLPNRMRDDDDLTTPSEVNFIFLVSISKLQYGIWPHQLGNKFAKEITLFISLEN